MSKVIATAIAVALCICMLPACSSSSDRDDEPSPKIAEEAASHYYYDSDGHIHRDY